MEPQIADYYNEIPHGVKVIDRLNEEFNELQKENDILRDDLYMNSKYGRPVVKYENATHLETVKMKIYKELKNEIYLLNGNISEKTIKNVLYKLIPNYNEVKIKFNVGLTNEHERTTGTNWVHWKSIDILKYVNYSTKSLKDLNIEQWKIYENIYNIITSEINNLLDIDGNIVKYKCKGCNKLVNMIMHPTSANICVSCCIKYISF